jgi:hypothetical protein
MKEKVMTNETSGYRYKVSSSDNKNATDPLHYDSNSTVSWTSIGITNPMTARELYHIMKDVVEVVREEYPAGRPAAHIGVVADEDAGYFGMPESGIELHVRYDLAQISMPISALAKTANGVRVQLEALFAMARQKHLKTKDNQFEDGEICCDNENKTVEAVVCCDEACCPEDSKPCCEIPIGEAEKCCLPHEEELPACDCCCECNNKSTGAEFVECESKDGENWTCVTNFNLCVQNCCCDTCKAPEQTSSCDCC